MFSKCFTFGLLTLLAVSCHAQFEHLYEPSEFVIIEDGQKRVVYRVEPLDRPNPLPPLAYDLYKLWDAVRQHPHFDTGLGGRIYGYMFAYESDIGFFHRPETSLRVKRWDSSLRQLESRTALVGKDIKAYASQVEEYNQEHARYQNTPLTVENQAAMNLWVQRLGIEFERLGEQKRSWEAKAAALVPEAQKIDEEGREINASRSSDRTAIIALRERILTAVLLEQEIAVQRQKLAEARAKVKKNADALSTISKISTTIAEGEKWAELTEDERKQARFDAMMALIPTAISELISSPAAKKAVSVVELRQVKQVLMYKFNLDPTVVKATLKGWVDNGSGSVPFKSKAELFKSLETLLNAAETAHHVYGKKYWEAFATILENFVHDPVLKLVILDFKLVSNLISVGLTYYHADKRIEDLWQLSNKQLVAVEKLAALNKKIVDDEILPGKKELSELEARRVF